jgi:hypothetical protein
MAPENKTVQGKIDPNSSQKVTTIEQACRRFMSSISSLRAARWRHASARMNIDTQIIIVIPVPFHTTPGSGYRRNSKVIS